MDAYPDGVAASARPSLLMLIDHLGMGAPSACSSPPPRAWPAWLQGPGRGDGRPARDPDHGRDQASRGAGRQPRFQAPRRAGPRPRPRCLCAVPHAGCSPYAAGAGKRPRALDRTPPGHCDRRHPASARRGESAAESGGSAPQAGKPGAAALGGSGHLRLGRASAARRSQSRPVGEQARHLVQRRRSGLIRAGDRGPDPRRAREAASRRRHPCS